MIPAQISGHLGSQIWVITPFCGTRYQLRSKVSTGHELRVVITKLKITQIGAKSPKLSNCHPNHPKGAWKGIKQLNYDSSNNPLAEFEYRFKNMQLDMKRLQSNNQPLIV